MVDVSRLLEDTCEAAMVILPCNLAWLLVAEDSLLRSKIIVTDKGASAAEVFLRLLSGGKPEHLALHLVSGINPISETALDTEPRLNLTLEMLSKMHGAAFLHRAIGQLRLRYVHLVPLVTQNRAVIGMLVLGSNEPHDSQSTRGKRLLEALVNQSVVAVENARLVANIALREDTLRAEQAFRKMILDTMGDGVLVVDENALIRYANNRLLFMTGYIRQELYGSSTGVIFHPGGRDALIDMLRKGGRGTVTFSQQLITKTGRVVPVLMSRATAPAVDYQGLSTVLVLSDLTEQKSREAALERQSERLKSLNAAVQTITSPLALEAVLEQTLHHAKEVTGGVSACILLQQGDQTNRLRVVMAVGPQAAALQEAVIEMGEGVAGRAAVERRSILATIQQGDRTLVKVGSTVLVAPLIVNERVIGVLEVINKADGMFSEDDVKLLENIASAGSVAIERAQLLEQQQRRVNELSTLLDASSAASSTLELNNVLELIARRLREALNAARCAILTWDKTMRTLTVLAEDCNAYWETGQGPERTFAATVALSLFSTARLSNSRVILGRMADANLDPRIRIHLTNIGMTSMMVGPVRLGHAVIGIVELYKVASDQDFTPLHLGQVEDHLTRWNTQVAQNLADDWVAHERLSELAHKLMQVSRASWCVISIWDKQERKARAVREIGFAVWEDQTTAPIKLDDHPTLARSLEHGMPMTFYSSLLFDDPNVKRLMGQVGANTGLITPLLVRGEASGLVQLLDTAADRDFDLAEITLCQGIANMIGNALENAQLYQSLEKRANAVQTAYDELRESERLKDELIQNISHELKTPLHKISMGLDLLATDVFGPLNREQQEHVADFVTWVSHAATLVNDMVMLYKLNAQNMQFAAVRLDGIISHSIEKARTKASKVGMKLLIDIAPDLPIVRADGARLSDVLDQLLDNAIKFSPKGDRIELRAWNPNSHIVQLSVQDYGIGIPATELEKIFQRGYQVDGGMTRRFSGTGLGLAIVRGVVEAHGGKIWVESSPGRGSKFNVAIPSWNSNGN